MVRLRHWFFGIYHEVSPALLDSMAVFQSLSWRAEALLESVNSEGATT